MKSSRVKLDIRSVNKVWIFGKLADSNELLNIRLALSEVSFR